MSKRATSVAGTFYPSTAQEIEGYMHGFNGGKDEFEPKLKAKAIISPHAGYVFSGACANAAYRRIDISKIKRVIVIGPSHRVYLEGASVALYDSYESPCANLKIDLIPVNVEFDLRPVTCQERSAFTLEKCQN